MSYRISLSRSRTFFRSTGVVRDRWGSISFYLEEPVRLAKWLFLCHLTALVLALCGLLLVIPHADELWRSNPSRVTAWQGLLRFAGSLQILFGAATMLFFGWFAVGSRQALVFFGASLLISFLLGTWIIDKTAFLGIFTSDVASTLDGNNLDLSLILLFWLYMGFASYLLAWKLAIRLGLHRQTFWSLVLGTYFLLAWAAMFQLTLTGLRGPAQTSVLHSYGSTFGLPTHNALNWLITAPILLGLIQLLWRGRLDTQHLTIGLPFGIYTANIGFVMILSFGMGLWFPLFVSALFVLAPETLAFYPRERTSSGAPGRLNAWISQFMWLAMRGGALVLARHQIKLRAQGLEHIPRSGPVLLAARHFHFFYDGYILVRTVPRRLHILVALDWLQVQALRLLIELGCGLANWPVVLRGEELKRRSPEKSWAYQSSEGRRYLRQAIHDAVRLLRSGEVLVVFPEGHPNVDPHPTPKADLETFLPFHDGLVRMAEQAEKDGQTRVAIVPVGLEYHRLRGKRWQVSARFGQPLYLKNFASGELALQAVEEQVRSLSYALPLSAESGQSENT